MQIKTQALAINEAPPYRVAYVTEGETTYVKLTKEDFEAILYERRRGITMVKLWMALALVAAVMLAGSTYWFSTHPITRIVPIALGNTQ